MLFRSSNRQDLLLRFSLRVYSRLRLSVFILLHILIINWRHVAVLLDLRVAVDSTNNVLSSATQTDERIAVTSTTLMYHLMRHTSAHVVYGFSGSAWEIDLNAAGKSILGSSLRSYLLTLLLNDHISMRCLYSQLSIILWASGPLSWQVAALQFGTTLAWFDGPGLRGRQHISM